MIDPYLEIKDIIVDEIETRLKDNEIVNLGKIDPAYNGGRPAIVFDGESTVSVKRYPFLLQYVPRANDRVMLVKGVVVGAIK